MELSFSRGFLARLAPRLRPQDARAGHESSAKRGVRLGTVVAVPPGRVAVDLAGRREAGRRRGLRLRCDERRGRRAAASTRCSRRAGRSPSRWPRAAWSSPSPGSAFDLGRLAAGAGGLEDRRPGAHSPAAQDVSRATPPAAAAVDLARDGRRRAQPLRVRGPLGRGRDVRGRVGGAGRARRRSIRSSAEMLREQFGRLGGTPFELRGLTAEIDRPADAALQRAGHDSGTISSRRRLANGRFDAMPSATVPTVAAAELPRRG